MADMKMGALFLLTGILQSFVEKSTAGLTIRFEEAGQNYSFYLNESFEELEDVFMNYSEYYGYDSYFYDNGTLDYEDFVKIAKDPHNSTGPLHSCHWILLFVSLLHSLPVLLRVLDARH